MRRKATSAESTFGGGRKTVGETGWKPVRSAVSRTSTETAPYAFVRGSAKRRSATSRCTITVQCRTVGSPSRLSTTSGVATLYGRFATSFVGGGSSSWSGSWSASPKTSSTFPCAARRSRERGLERGVELDRMDVGGARREVLREDAEPGADLEHDVVRVELGEPADHAEDVRIGEEVLAELLLRADAHGSENARAAFASICASSPVCSSPRASASAASVCTTCAGSLRRPRTGWGAR